MSSSQRSGWLDYDLSGAEGTIPVSPPMRQSAGSSNEAPVANVFEREESTSEIDGTGVVV
jgi:hypothetical protein